MSFNALRICGFVGTGLAIIAVLIPALVYRGKRGERYSLLNHFISELGEAGVSRAAWFFNGCLLLGGLILLPYIIGLGFSFGSLLGWLGATIGIVAVLAVAAVGIFPMNNLKPHTIAAMTYFRAGLGMVLFFGLAILFQSKAKPVVSPAANMFSLLAFLADGAFLALPRLTEKEKKVANPLDPDEMLERPRFWAFPTLEWAVFFSTIAWLLGMAILI